MGADGGDGGVNGGEGGIGGVGGEWTVIRTASISSFPATAVVILTSLTRILPDRLTVRAEPQAVESVPEKTVVT